MKNCYITPFFQLYSFMSGDIIATSEGVDYPQIVNDPHELDVDWNKLNF